MELNGHLRLQAQPVGQTQGLLVPTFRFFEHITGVEYGAQFVVNQDNHFLIPVFFQDGLSPAVPAFRFVVLKLELGGQAQGPEVFDLLLRILQSLVDVQRFAEPLFRFGVKTLMLLHLADAVVIVGGGRFVFAFLDNGQGLLVPL